MRHLYEHFLKHYECYIIMNYDGMYLKDLKTQNQEFCNGTVHIIFKEEYSKLLAKYIEFCPSKQACTQSKYSIETEVKSNKKYCDQIFPK